MSILYGGMVFLTQVSDYVVVLDEPPVYERGDGTTINYCYKVLVMLSAM